MDKTFFAGVNIQEVELSTGVRIGLPRRYYDWSGILAHFPVPAAAVRKLLPTNKLKPAQLVPGIAMLSLMAIEYRKIADVPPYNEFAIMVPVLYEPTVNIPGLPLVLPHWFKRFGLYVHHMPVTTQWRVTSASRSGATQNRRSNQLRRNKSNSPLPPPNRKERHCDLGGEEDGYESESYELLLLHSQRRPTPETLIQAQGQFGIAKFEEARRMRWAIIRLLRNCELWELARQR